MLDDESTTSTTSTTSTEPTGAAAPRRRRAASRPAGPPAPLVGEPTGSPAQPVTGAADQPPAEPTAAVPVAKKATRKRAGKRADAAPASDPDAGAATAAADEATPARRTRKRAAAQRPAVAPAGDEVAAPAEDGTDAPASATLTPPPPGVLFQPPEPVAATPRRRSAAAKAAAAPAGSGGSPGEDEADETDASGGPDGDLGEDGDGGSRRRRRGGRGRRGRGRDRDETGAPDGDEETEPASLAGAAGSADSDEGAAAEEPGEAPEGDGSEGGEGGGTRRRRRRRRRGSGDAAEVEDTTPDDALTVVRVREPRSRGRAKDTGDDDGVRSVKGSTRLEAKKQRRREGREAGRRRPSIITEAEFLARRESVERTMIVRQSGDRTQIAVLEDDVLVEHYVNTASSNGLVGNVYLGKVQNVLPSMEAAFVDIGKGRNAVLYAGEVNWDAAGLDGQPRRIELALKSGDSVLVQVTKDPIGHKGARLTSQISLAGRYLVLVPGNSMTGISRKLPDTERSRLKAILKKVVPEGAGVIVRTAAEGASEDELARDVARLTAQWEDIERKSAKGASSATLLYGEPDMTIRVVRDIFNEDFGRLLVSGDDAWDMLEPYIGHVAPDLRERMSRWTDEQDVFTAHRVDEQLAKALDRKVWLPSGGYLIIDRTEAMIVVDVNTGKFTGAGGNLEETVTKNNLEAAEEIVRQLRLRDLGGIIVIDFIDMVLESNRDLVLRRLLECLGRDRTKHQVAEVTSLGLVQMTRKRVGQGLHEAFAETCEACNGRGYHIQTEPVESRSGGGDGRDRRGGGGGGGRKAARPEPPKQPAAEPAVIDAAADDPVATEDPVEGESPAPAKRARRRRSAASPVTTL